MPFFVLYNIWMTPYVCFVVAYLNMWVSVCGVFVSVWIEHGQWGIHEGSMLQGNEWVSDR